MRGRRAAWVAAFLATLVAPVMARAAEFLPAQNRVDPAVVVQSTPSVPAQRIAPSATASAARPTGLKYDLGAATSTADAGSNHRADDFVPYASARPIDHAQAHAGTVPGATGLKLRGNAYTPKPGWELSGRLGPVRWLSTVDGETTVRLGGRVPGQPRMPGMGLFNLGVHYNFE